MSIPTQIDVRVIAKDGKYLGDDIGGALVTIRDVHTGELLARGTTGGGSGQPDLMDICLTRSEVLPVDGASVFTASLDLSEPRLIRVTAYGPLAAQNAANTVSLTQWVYPGKNTTGGEKGGGFLLEVPGLVVQIMNPPTHFLPQTAPPSVEIRANVTMMCGCPIGKGHPPWHPEQFDVMAVIKQGEYSTIELPLNYDEDAPYAAPSQFVNTWTVPENNAGQPQIYEITVSAFQQRTGNTGVDKATIIIPPASKDASSA
jgi:hypothetical protein